MSLLGIASFQIGVIDFHHTTTRVHNILHLSNALLVSSIALLFINIISFV